MLKKTKKYISVAIIFSLFQQMLVPVKVYTTTKEIDQKRSEIKGDLKNVQRVSQIQTKNQAEIEKQIRDLTAKMEEVTKKIESLNNDTYKNQDEIFKTLENIDTINSQVNKLNVDIENMQKELEVMEDSFLSYLKHIYTQKNDQMSLLDGLFNSKNYDELIRNMKYTGAYSEHIQNIQENYRKKANEIKIIQDIKNKEVEKHQKAIKVNQENINKNTTNATEMEKLYAQHNELLKALKENLAKCKSESEAIRKIKINLEKDEEKFKEKQKESNIPQIKEQAKPEEKKEDKDKDKNKDKPKEQEKPEVTVNTTGGVVFPVLGNCSIFQEFHKGHHGVDIQTYGHANPVVASCDGTVIAAGKNAGGSGYGLCVIFRTPDGHEILNAHLSSICTRVGQTVKAGQQIGNVGNTGNVSGRTGMHLHYEERVGGRKISPRLPGRKGGKAPKGPNQGNKTKKQHKKDKGQTNQNKQITQDQQKRRNGINNKINNKKVAKPN